jgi:hypothetical protein
MTKTKISDGFETFTTPASTESFIAEDFFLEYLISLNASYFHQCLKHV